MTKKVSQPTPIIERLEDLLPVAEEVANFQMEARNNPENVSLALDKLLKALAQVPAAERERLMKNDPSARNLASYFLQQGKWPGTSHRVD